MLTRYRARAETSRATVGAVQPEDGRSMRVRCHTQNALTEGSAGSMSITPRGHTRTRRWWRRRCGRSLFRGEGWELTQALLHDIALRVSVSGILLLYQSVGASVKEGRIHCTACAKSFAGGFGEASPPRNPLSGASAAAKPPLTRQKMGYARGGAPRAPDFAHALEYIAPRASCGAAGGGAPRLFHRPERTLLG